MMKCLLTLIDGEPVGLEGSNYSQVTALRGNKLSHPYRFVIKTIEGDTVYDNITDDLTYMMDLADKKELLGAWVESKVGQYRFNVITLPEYNIIKDAKYECMNFGSWTGKPSNSTCTLCDLLEEGDNLATDDGILLNMASGTPRNIGHLFLDRSGRDVTIKTDGAITYLFVPCFNRKTGNKDKNSYLAQYSVPTKTLARVKLLFNL